jgi:hypothetical protein
MSTEDKKTEQPCTLQSVIESYTIDELKYVIKGKEQLLEEIKEHSIGDSCGALSEFTAESELKIMRKELSCR